MEQTRTVTDLLDRITHGIEGAVYGHRATARLLCGAMLIGGHALLEGPPGIAKTLLARSFARVIGLHFKRIQFTPDLMPGDVTGVTVFDRESSSFRFVPGPIFTDILLADEINRTPPKTQSALLEAMEEGAVTVEGVSHRLNDLFLVVATQNPIEHEGTFPLPEAQLDRFLFRLLISYPPQEMEEQMIVALSSRPAATPAEKELKALVSADEIQAARQILRRVRVQPALGNYVMRLITATRSHPEVLLGASSRAGLHLTLAAKMNAVFSGRDYVIPDDVKAVISPVLNHRLILKPQLRATQHTSLELINEIVASVSPPDRLEA